MEVDHLISAGEKEWIKEIDWKTGLTSFLRCFLYLLLILFLFLRKGPGFCETFFSKVAGYYHICVRSHYYGVMENSVRSEGCQGDDLDINIGAKRREETVLRPRSMDGQAFCQGASA